MGTAELIKEIQKLPFQEKIFVIERTIHSLRKKDDSMRKAAEILYDDYVNESELTAFTSLDFENFYETR